MFSKPFNGRVLNFNYNKLRILPADLFTDMPNLETVGLKGNSIATLPVNMFKTRFPKLEYFLLEGNPISCDTDLRWLLTNKPPVLTGMCFWPSELRGRVLCELDPEDLISKL